MNQINTPMEKRFNSTESSFLDSLLESTHTMLRAAQSWKAEASTCCCRSALAGHGWAVSSRRSRCGRCGGRRWRGG